MSLNLPFWKNASPRRKRIYSAMIIFLIAVLLTVVGSLVPISAQDATQISNDLNQTIAQNKNAGSLTQYIFLNNFSICLIMFIPVVGPLLGFFILFSTGIAIGAISSVQGISPLLNFTLLAITPIFWLEFVSYSIAITESIWLLRRIMQKRIFREIKILGIAIAICAGLLITGALVEAWLISIAG
jgi:hypothetical protein